MSDDIEWMWLFLLRDGHDSLTGREQIRLPAASANAPIACCPPTG